MEVTAAEFDKWLDREIAKQPRTYASGKIRCSKCGDECNRKRQRYCKKCHSQYMRQWRAGVVS